MALHLILNLFSDENTRYIDCEERTSGSIIGATEGPTQGSSTPKSDIDITIDNSNVVNMEVAGPVTAVIVILVVVIVCVMCKKVRIKLN